MAGPKGTPGPLMVEPIGTRVMCSPPPATTSWYPPAMIPWAANWTACWEEPHCRSIVVAGTSSGSPAASQTLRAALADCSPTWDTQPMITSSTSSGSIPLRSTSARSATAPRSTACTPDSPPLRRPTGVLTAPTTTGSRPGPGRSFASMCCPFPRSLQRRWHRPPPGVNQAARPRMRLPGLLDGDALQAQLLHRAVRRVGVDLGHGLDHVHALDDLAEDGVLAVEPGRRHLGDEELGAVGAGAGVGHGQVPGPVEAVGTVDLVLELVAGAAPAVPERVAALDHEVGDDPVEDRALVQGPLLLGAGGRVAPRLGAGGQADEVLDRLGCGVGEQADPDGALGGLQGRVGVGHASLLAVEAGPRVTASAGSAATLPNPARRLTPVSTAAVTNSSR